MHDHAEFDGAEFRSLPYQVFAAFHRAMHSHRQLMTRRLTERGTHPGQAVCLRELAHNDGISQSDLAERMSLARPTVNVMLKKMEAAGQIERRTDPDDQRFTRIYLTDLGRDVLRDMRKVLDSVVDELAGPLSETDQRELIRLLGLLDDNVVAALGTDLRPDPTPTKLAANKER